MTLSDSTHIYFTHSEDSVCGGEVVSPGNTQYIGQIEAKVYEPPTGSSQVGFGEEGTNEETLHDGGSGKRHEEEKDNRRVAVWQNVPPLEEKKDKKALSIQCAFTCPLICLLWSERSSHLEHSNEKRCRGQERNHAADEPAEPQRSRSQTHNPHGFLQPCLLLVYHAFDDHGNRVDPGQSHEERQGAVQHPEETVKKIRRKLRNHDQGSRMWIYWFVTLKTYVNSLPKHQFTATHDSHIIHIAGVGHLLDVDACSLLNSSQDSAHSSFHQVLDVNEAAPNVAHVIKWVSCWARIPKPEEVNAKNLTMSTCLEQLQS